MRVSSILGALLLIALTICSSLFGNETEVPDARSDLLSSIESAIALGMSMEPFNVIIEYSSSSEFPDELASTEEVRCRYIKSSHEEVVVYAMEYRKHDLRKDAKDLVLVSTSIDGNQVAIKRGGPNTPDIIVVPSFDTAIKRVRLPDPAYWGVFHYSTGSDFETRLKILSSRILDDSASITRGQTVDGLTYSLTDVKGPNEIEYWTWRFGLPDLNPTYLRFEREMNGGPRHTVVEQSVIWERIEEKVRPVQLFGSIGIVRPEEGKAELTIGRLSYDLQFRWLPMPIKIAVPEFPTSAEIIRYIDNGYEESRIIEARNRKRLPPR